MRRPRVTINAAVLATAIWVYARFETNIRTVIPRDDRLGSVAKKLCRALWPPLLVVQIDIDNSHRSCERGIDIVKIDMQLFEPVGRTPGSAAAMDWRVTLRRLLDHRPKLQFHPACHTIGSYEHIMLSRSFLLNFYCSGGL